MLNGEVVRLDGALRLGMRLSPPTQPIHAPNQFSEIPTAMLAAVAHAQNPNDPLSCLELREVPTPVAPEGWTRVKVKASSLNMHDVWTLRGVGHDPKNIPIILGCDVAGVTDDGREVVVYPVIADPDAGNGDETLDPNRALLSERHDGGFAEYIVVPDRCVIPKPEQLSFEEAACLPVAWSTAYRMLFTQGQLKAGDRVLVQGAGGGVASAAIALAAAAGATVYATSRTADEARPGAWNSAPTRHSSPVHGCPSAWTWSSRRSGRPRGATRCAACARAAPS